MEGKKNIYVVTSYSDTVPGKLICYRASLKFWNRYEGDNYSHVSLSLDKSLTKMLSFARKEINNPFNSGLVQENIKEGMFVLKPEKSKIAVMEIGVSQQQFIDIEELMKYFWERRDDYHFNFLGLTTMLIYGKGVNLEDHYFCSQWVATLLQQCGLDFFNGEKPYNIRPFDFYRELKKFIIYEGLTVEYPAFVEKSFASKKVK